MARRFRLDFSTAYGQLILLVFLPITVLAISGGILVLSDTTRAARTIQKATADSLISDYQDIITDIAPRLNQLNAALVATTQATPQSPPLSTRALADEQAQLRALLQNDIQDKHLQGMAIVNEDNQILVSYGNVYPSRQPITPYSSVNRAASNLSNVPLLVQLNHQPTSLFSMQDGTLYGEKLVFDTQHPQTASPPKAMPALWLVVNVDNEPLRIARYQVLLALAITGLITVLLLLLSLNIYARRWIAPIYELRLHLQRTNAKNLYKPMHIESSGEINELQKDLVKTLRRLHTAFQDLKNHAEQTEDDLRMAFDEMEMQNISIRNARDAAVSASQTKSAFLANISHELRTPLNSIDGFINLLSRHGGLTAEQDLYVQTIRKSSAHLLALVNDVLDFSKIEAGKLVLDRHEFDLYASIYDVVDMLSPLAAEKGLRLAVFFYDDVPRHLLGDALRVKQILTNLVNNAIKFTDDGEVVVRVSLDDERDDSLHISVSDTGRGISPEHRQVLFQSFSQGDPSITRQYGGTGLGLVISQQLSFLMGGQIGFYDNASEQGETGNLQTKIKGTTFWFTLPIRLSNQGEQQQLTQAPVWELPNVLGLGRMGEDKLQVLVWISHTASLQVLKGSLRQLPIEISTTTSLAGLLEALQEKGNRWDWVIVDHNSTEDTTSLLKQVRLYYAGKLALYGYQVNLDPTLLTRYQAHALYQPLDRRQLYQLLDTNTASHYEPMLPQWHGFKVLAVDDHLPNLLVLEALLGELGIETVTASSGFDAIDYITHQHAHPDYAVDLIFMDIQMPRMSGSEASLQIRQIEMTEYQGKHIPIVALTAHSLSDERDKLLASGIDDYVGKPISQAQLLQVLQRWLGKHSDYHLKTLALSDSLEKSDSLDPHQAVSLPPTFQAQQTPQAPLPRLPNLTASSPTNVAPQTDTVTSHALTQAITPYLAVIDWEDAVARVAGKPDLATNLLIMLIESVDQEKADLVAAWQRHDRQALSHVAHRILGASRYTGVPQLRQASQNLEDKCLLNIDNSSPAQFAMLTPYYEALLQALDNLKQADLSDYPQLKYAQLKEHDMTWKMI